MPSPRPTRSPVFATRGRGPGGWIYVVKGRWSDGSERLVRASAIMGTFSGGRSCRHLAHHLGIPQLDVEQVVREAMNGAKWWRA